jgi:hypothetical protein
MIGKAEIRQYYEILGVAPDCSPDELKLAYRDLLVVWHPDRFQQSPRLRLRAEERTKLINAACQFLGAWHGHYTEEMLADDESAWSEQFRVAETALWEARAEAEAARHSAKDIRQEALIAAQHAAEAIAQAHEAMDVADQLRVELDESRRLMSFWCERAMEERRLRESSAARKARKWKRRLKWSLGSVLGFVGFVRMAVTMGVWPSLVVLGIIIAFGMIRRSPPQPSAPKGVEIPPPLPRAQILSHPFEQLR